MARFDSFFSGSSQQDVNECFCRLTDILHHGTKENLLSDLNTSGPEDEQFIHSLTKRLFLFNLKHHLQCLKCRLISISYSESRSFFVYPFNNCSIEDILKNNVKTTLDKTCRCCMTITKHDEILTFEHPPEFLVLVISRFDNNSGIDKNRDKIEVCEDITVTSLCYRLVGSIHHHGTTIASGHYTCNVWYPDSAYLCNDSQILPLSGPIFSDSVYMIVYARNETPTS